MDRVFSKKTIASGLWAIPIVFLIRLIRPIILIRVGTFLSSRAGHFIADAAYQWIVNETKTKAKTFVIEVPNDNEALNSLFENKAYQKNQHSSEHLYYFNSKTLRSVVESSNLEVRTETQLQRYTLANHFGWLKNQKRGGQNIWETFNERGLNDSYEKILIDQGVADSLFFICTRKG